MGTTLQNGVYLPSEGERNCYAGLKTNWEILDQKVADVTALQQAVAGALHREIVESLPTTDIDPNTIYMILSGTSATENVYNEFMYVNNAWELIGTSATDLTNYYTKGDVDGLLLLKANASDLTSHTGDTTIHVTASDKSKWNTVALIKQLRLVNAQVGSATTIAFANIDDTNGIKVGDKCMDLDAKMFEITAVDTTNETVTVGSALIDIALDGNVVHTSGNETVSGDKVFNNRLIKNIDVVLGTAPSTGKFSNIDIADNNKSSLLQVLGGVYDTGNSYARFFVQNKTADDGTGLSPTGTLRTCGFNINLPASSTSEGQGSITPRANKTTDFGLLSYQWRNLWCEKLFLNGTQLDPSAFVTTDTNQTISGNKTFGNGTLIVDNGTGNNVHGEIKLNGSRSGYIVADNASDGVFDSAQCGVSILLQDSGKPLHVGGYKVDSNGRVFVDNTNKNPVLSITSSLIQTSTLVPENDSTGALFRILSRLDYANGDPSKTLDVRFQQNDDADATSIIYSQVNNKTSLGTAAKKWKDCQTYLINGLTPSSLSLPSGNASNFIDISSYLVYLDGTTNTYTAPANGWISIAITGTAIAIVSSSWSDSRLRESSGNVRMLYPVLKNETLDISVTGTTLAYARFIPCQGNV